MANRVNIRINSVVFTGGQETDNGVTMSIDAACQVGDLVTTDTVLPNKVVRGALGAIPVGVVEIIEKDGLGTVQSTENIQILALTGPVILGIAGLQCNGDGTAKLVAFAPATARSVNVYGSQVVNGVTYVAVADL